MKYEIQHQEEYSRGELLLRSFFGWIYILIPHMFILYFLAIWGAILAFISFFAILFTGVYPKGFFEYRVKLMRWSMRVSARLLNLCDGYPAFGLDAEDERITLEVPYPERISRGNTLLKFFFGWLYIALPHIFILYFRRIGVYILTFIAWWSILLTGKYPASFHSFVVGTMRWGTRVGIALAYMTDDYPPFHGRPIEYESDEVILDSDMGEKE
jgi:hypothetical protein